jgi:hypothetical protein
MYNAFLRERQVQKNTSIPCSEGMFFLFLINRFSNNRILRKYFYLRYLYTEKLAII